MCFLNGCTVVGAFVDSKTNTKNSEMTQLGVAIDEKFVNSLLSKDKPQPKMICPSSDDKYASCIWVEQEEKH